MCSIDILKKGGNAVDAAIAANACENVVEPMMNGLGGDIMAFVWNATTKKLTGYNGSGRSPKGQSFADMQASLKDLGDLKYIPGDGPLPVSVPGAAKGWCDLHARFGKLPWAALFDSAIGYARDGHPVAQVIAEEW
jgi:gamma-glutamyltranspeptidase/glutathione hydrolase